MSVLAGSKHRTEVITGVTRFLFSDVAIIEIQVAYKRRIIESCTVGCGFVPTANQRDEWISTEVLQLRTQHLYWRSFNRSNCAAQRIQYAYLKLLTCLL